MKSKEDLLYGPIGSTLRRFTYPLAISFIIHILYSWVDTFYVSRLGDDNIAAIGFSENIVFFIFTICGGFGIGSGIVVARRTGEGNFDAADRTATMSIVFMLLYASAMAIILYFTYPYILNFMSVQGIVRQYVSEYIVGIIVGIPGIMSMFQINSIIRSTGNSKIPMYILITSSVINAIVSPFLIFGLWIFPKMGMFGAGLGTALAQWGGALLALFVIKRGITPVNIELKNFRFDWSIILRIFKIGIPASLQMSSVGLNRLILLALANTFGTTVVTTYHLGLKVDGFVFMSVFAFGVAIEIITGQNLGARNIRRIYEYYYSAIKHLSVIMLILAVGVFFFGKYFVLLFTESTEIMEKAVVYFKITAFIYIPFAIGIISTRVISGSGNTYRSLIIVVSILLLLQIPLAYILSHYIFENEVGIWVAILISHFTFAWIGWKSFIGKKWIFTRV